MSCSQTLADLLVRTEILDRADRDLEGTVHPRALVIGMTEVIADVRVDLLELGLEEPGSRELGAAQLPGLLDRQAALLGFVRDYAGVEDPEVGNLGVEDTG